jgi:hypothetical protein
MRKAAYPSVFYQDKLPLRAGRKETPPMLRLVERHAGERDPHGHALVVRHGKARRRSVTLGAGTIQIRA